MVMQTYYEFMEQCRPESKMIAHGCGTYGPEFLVPAPLLALKQHVMPACVAREPNACEISPIFWDMALTLENISNQF